MCGWESLGLSQQLESFTALVKSGVQSLNFSSEAGLFNTVVERTAAELSDAATQDRSTTGTTMRMGVDRRAKRPQC